MSRPLYAALLLLLLELCFPSTGLCKEDHDRARHPHTEEARQPHSEEARSPEPADSGQAPTVDFSVSTSGSAASGSGAPSTPAQSEPQPSQPDFCQHKDLLRYDFGFGGLTSDQAAMSFHRLLAIRDCHGVVMEHNMLRNGAAPGDALWQDRWAYVVGSSGGEAGQHDQYLYAGYTTAYGIRSTGHTTVGIMVVDHTFAPVNFEFMANASLFPLLERLIWSKQTYAPDWSPLDYETGIGVRLESRHAALRAGYQITNMDNFRRSGFYVGYSLMF